MSLLFQRYDEADLLRRFDETGLLQVLRAKGFADFRVALAQSDPVVPHILLRGSKAGSEFELVDACLRRLSVRADCFGASGEEGAAALDLLLVHWVREEDPTSSFSNERPALPLQNHPGLGVLRRAFRVALGIAQDLGLDGIANRPKFFHDAAIFHHSRLFLFLDGQEQGRFEALVRDLETLTLRDASLAVAGWCVRDQAGPLHWQPGLQVFPLTPRLAQHFHSDAYAAAVDAGRAVSHFVIDQAALAEVRAQLHLDLTEGSRG